MRKIRNTCLQYRCVRCCLNTEMLLSSSDIVRIRSLVFSEDFFIVKKDANHQLKNLSGRCAFHNGQRCTIYSLGLRAVGCTRPFSMKTREKQISIHTAHITESFT